MPPRYHSESLILAKFLTSYSKANPTDVDVLFDLIRIFLQPSSIDFSFVKQFLNDTVSEVLSSEQKCQVMQRFLTLLSSDGSDETKTLSLQMLVYPMLRSTFRQTTKNYPPPTANTLNKILPDATIKDLILILCKDGSSFHPKLTCELLRLINILLENIRNKLTEHRKDMIKYIWNILKSDDNGTKYFGYLVVSRFVVVFETPPKVTLQVYVSLLRSHHSTEKHMVRAALDTLVPSLPNRLTEDELGNAIKYTLKLMYEQVNSVPQLAHLWDIITRNPNVYIGHKSKFLPHMVNSLTKLGLSPNAPAENKELSVELAKLIVTWVEFNEPVKLVGGAQHEWGNEHSSKNSCRGFLEPVVNFLIRMAIVNAEGKADRSQNKLRIRILSVLNDIISVRQDYEIIAAPLERVRAHCEEACTTKNNPPDSIHKDDFGMSANAKKNIKSISHQNSTTQSYHSSPQKKDEICAAHDALSVCLEIFLIFQRHDPRNYFIQKHLCIILPFGFSHLASNDDSNLKQVIKSLLTLTLADGDASSESLSSIICLLNNAISCSVLNPAVSARQCQEKKCGSYLAIEIIEEVSARNRIFVESFIGSLVDFAFVNAKSLILEIEKNKNPQPMQQLAGNAKWLPATPTIGIFETACNLGFKTPSSGSKELENERLDTKIVTVKEVDDIEPSTCALISCLRLIASSSIRLNFSERRRKFIDVLNMLLDSCKKLPILITVVAVIRKWLTEEDGRFGPLTRGEREDFLWKMISFDYHDLPQVASNALSDMVCITAMGACGYNLTQLQHRPNDVQNNAHEFKISVSQPSQDILRDQMIRKLFVTCLLSANFRLRSMAVVIFGTEQNEVKVACDSLESICARDVLTGNNSISGRSPFDILRQLLSADYEGLGKRLWTTIFAEILLACSDHSDGAYLACKQSEHQLFEPREKSKTVKRARGFLRPTQYQASKQQVLHTNRNNDYILNTTYSTFQKAILTERARKRFGRGRCLIAMRTLIHGCVDTCQLIFCCVLKAAWQNIPTNERRASLIKPMESLLSRPYHAQFLKIRENSRINAIQSILGVILHLRPLPSLDVFLIRSLASNYSCQREVLSYFEQHFTVLKRNGLEVNISSSELIQSILHVYKTLGDDDMIVSINSSLSTFKGTKFALSLDMYGFVIKSTDAYLALIDRVDGARKDFAPPEFELSVWEDRWVKGYKELSQWHLIDEFAASHGDPELMMECAWKVKNWDKVKSLCASPSVIASLVDGDPVTKMSEIFLAIHEGKLSEVENLHAQTAQLCLHKWQLLPSIGTDSNPHKVLLQQFQRLVELRESSQVMVETSSHSSGRTIPDLKNLLSSWRHRVPNSFEPISVWEDLFLWRQQIFDAVTSNFSWSEPGTLATLHDRPWTCISLCRTARKHGLKEVSMLSLSNLTECAMDVQDAFLKLREQVFTYRNATASHLKGGLNVVNSTNLSFFDARQKAELFRLKGFFLDALNDKTSSNQAYCNSVQICPTYSKAWVDWGNLCASLFVITRKKADNQPDAKLESTKKSNQYLAQAMGCFLEAVRCDASEHSRDRIPHCLSMISNDGAQYGILCQTLEARGVLLPAWVWLPWIPQLLTSLCRIEARAVKSIIGEVVKDHPQAVYYSLRAFFLERRDVDRSRGQDADSKDEESLLSVKYAELLMSNLRKLHPILWSKLEVILEDLIIRFRPSYEAELLATITALLQKASSRVELKSSKEEKNKEEHSLLESYHTTLKRIGMKFFNKEKPDGSKSRKAVLFHAKYASMFECDFLRQQTGPNGAVYSGPASIPELVERLKRWKLMIEYQVSRVPSSCKLQEASPSLAWYSCEPPDLWAGKNVLPFVISITLSRS